MRLSGKANERVAASSVSLGGVRRPFVSLVVTTTAFSAALLHICVLARNGSSGDNLPKVTTGAFPTESPKVRSHSPFPLSSRERADAHPLNKAASVELPRSIEGDHELAQMLEGECTNVDLGLANWLIAADVPGFSDLTCEAYFSRLDAMTEQVREAMRIDPPSGLRANDPAVRCGRFCNAIIKLGFAYREEFRRENLSRTELAGLYADPDNIFLAGLLRSRHGTCVSMPLIYLVIGQRLGLPVHLVTIGRHYFIRWEEPGLRLNIEPTIVERVAVTPDDSVYLETEGMTPNQVRGNQLKNLTPREVLGNLFFTRAAHWGTKGPKYRRQQYADLSRARLLAPNDPGIAATHEAVFNQYGKSPRDTGAESEIIPKRRKGT